MKYLDEILEFWLPNKPSRLIAGMSITLGIASIALPHFLRLIHIKVEEHIALLIRIATPLLIWLVGSLFVLLIVVRHCKTLKTQRQPTTALPKPKIKLKKLQKSILLHIHKNIDSSFIFQIVQTLNISEEIAEYHLQTLHEINFIEQGLPDKPGRPWHITDKGKKYLIENKLIS